MYLIWRVAFWPDSTLLSASGTEMQVCPRSISLSSKEERSTEKSVFLVGSMKVGIVSLEGLRLLTREVRDAELNTVTLVLINESHLSARCHG